MSTSHNGENPCLNPDNIVYYLSETKPDDMGARKLQIRKGTISEPHPPVESDKPRGRAWHSRTEHPSAVRVVQAMDPNKLFTGEEIVSIAQGQGRQETTADEAIQANHDELAVAIGMTLMLREIDQHLGA